MTGTDAIQRHTAAVRARLLLSEHVRAGPDSISWKVNREMVVVAGWGRAILLQLAHPAVAAGVHEHSSFRGSPLAAFRRMHSTVGAMLSLTFGDVEQMIAAAAAINAIHDRVRGHVQPSLKLRRTSLPSLELRRTSPPSRELPPAPAPHSRHSDEAGRRSSPIHEQPPAAALDRPRQPDARPGPGDEYSAHDPGLQRWVHATLLDSIPLTYELLVGPLTLRERDRYCEEATIMEPLLGMPDGWLPRDSAQLDSYVRDMLAGGSLVVTDTSRALARAVLYPPRWHVAWPAFRALQLLTIGTLPPSIRLAYGFDWRPRDARAFARWTALLRTMRRLLPPFAREWPMARRRDQPGAFPMRASSRYDRPRP